MPLPCARPTFAACSGPTVRASTFAGSVATGKRHAARAEFSVVSVCGPDELDVTVYNIKP